MKELPESDLNWKGVRFLDPLGKVFEYEGEFYRAIYHHKVEYVRSLFSKGIIDRLVQKGLIVETKITELNVEGYGLVLWHRRIPYLTTPDEWTRSFIKDAALCGIQLNLELLPFGLGTTDFHCGNFQQQGKCSPVWIDIGSICPLDTINQGKTALLELQKYYLHPLYLFSQKKNLNRACRLLMANGGIDDGEFNDLTNNFISTAGPDRRRLLEHIRDWIKSLTFPPLSTKWGDYQPKSPDFHFDPNRVDPRTELVYRIILDFQPKKVIDMSCNAGKFSLMAGRLGSAVFAVDLDEVAVERLYETARNIDEDLSITAALRNLAYNQKHLIQGELVLALALSHHLGISQKYPFSHVAKVFSSYSSEVLLTEFMPNGLGGTRRVPDPLPPDYSLENFIKAFEPYFRRIETIYYPVPKDWSYRVFVLCTEKRKADEQVGEGSKLYTSIFNPQNQDVQVDVICQYCGHVFNITYNIHSICPNCQKDFEFKKFSFKPCSTDMNETLVPASEADLSSHQRALRTEENHSKLEEILNQRIEISDLLTDSKWQSGRSAEKNSDCPQRVVHLSTHDHGGAGKAAYRLHKGLQQIGVTSTMLVVNKKSGDPSVKVFPSEYHGSLKQSLNVPTYASPIWLQQTRRWEIELVKYPNRPAGLEIFTDALSDIQLEQIQEIRDADIINLHWVAGTLDYLNASLALKDKKIVWTLHDMNPFTGGCHYSGDCEKYIQRCGACPQLGSTIEDDLSQQTWNQKYYALQNLDLNIVTPSKWLASCASKSRLLSKNPINVIPYGFPLDTYKPYTQTEIREALNIPENAKVVLFGADSIVNARKGFVYLLEALKRLPSNKEYTVVVLTFGAFPEGLQIDTKHEIYNLGSISDEHKLALAYSAADVFVIPSLEDNLPNTVVEAMACGVPVVSFDIGGIPDMIDHKKNGFLAKPKDVDSLLEGIDWALSSVDSSTHISALCRKKAETKFSLEIQANAYNELYNTLLSNPSLKSEDFSSEQNHLVHHPKRQAKFPDQLYQQAHKFIDEGRIEEAIGCFEELISNSPRFALAHNDLGVLYGNQSENEKALKFHEKAIQIEPKNIKFQQTLAEFYDKTGKPEQALGILIKLLKENPVDLDVLLALGRITLDLKKYDEALIFNQRALALSPASTSVRNAFLKLGEKFKLSGDFNKAREIFLYYLSHHPEDDQIERAWDELKDPEKNRQIIKKIKAKKNDYIVSALVSTYNSEDFIEECLQNLESQTIGNKLEIIVVDAASPQNEEKIVEEFQKRHSNITYIKTRGRIGIYTAWNIALKEASGRYCISASTNDILNQEACEILARYLDENPGCMLIYGDTYLTQTPHESFEKNTHSDTYRWPPYSFEHHLQNCLVGPHPMWRKQIHSHIGFFDERYMADGDQEFWLRIGGKYNITHIPFFTGLQWVSDEAISRKGVLPHLEVMHIRSLYQKRSLQKNEKKNRLCSIIIPVCNQVEYTRQCIEALYKHTPKSLFEIIVVDNNSGDGTQSFLAGRSENIRIISNRQNLGFAKACNQGAKTASGKYLLFLNNDTVPLPGWLEEMVDSVNSDADVGIVGSKLLYPDGTIQHAGIGFINGIPDHPFRNLPGDHPEANVLKEVDMVTGACLLIKKELFFECKGFDEQYINGVEDIDLCVKVRLKGHKVVYNPNSTLYHYEGKTPGRFDHVNKNLEIFFSRWEDYFDDHGNITHKVENQKLLINWEGSQFVNHSLALVNRELSIELAKQPCIELALIPYEPHEFGPQEDPGRFGLIEERLQKSLSGAAGYHVRHQWPPNFTPPPEGHWIMIQPWEFGALPKDWVEPMETLVDELWVPSQHVRDVYINSGISPDKVFVVPNGVNYAQFHPQAPKLTLATTKRLKFLFVGGTIMRKGIDVLLSAYREAFSSKDDVCLVIKDMGGESFYRGQNASQIIEDIKKDPNSPEILYLTETLKNEEIAGLYTACDCLVHPYRGEGFGLPVAEAMACGLPVIVTKGGACDDFCTEENAYLIGSTKRQVQLNGYILSAPAWLLEPDKSQLVERLKFVYENPHQAQQKGQIATNQIKSEVDWKMSKDLIMERLKALKDMPVRRFAGSADGQTDQTMKSPQEIYQAIQDTMKHKKPEQVIDELQMLAESHPEFALALNDLGVLHYHAGNKEKAHHFYEKAVKLDPKNTVFQKNLADFYYAELGNIEDALQIYIKILETNPDDVETLLITGHICVSLHQFNDARVFYHRVLELEPANEAARQNLEKLNQMGSTQPEFRTAEQRYQEILPLLNNGDPHKAIASLTELLERFPDFALAHNDLGVLFYHTDDEEKAQQHYERAVELMPHNINFQKNLADFYCIELGRIEDALKIYVSILATDPQDVETLMATAQICKALEKLDDARDFFNQVLQIEPWHAEARKHVAEIEEQMSRAQIGAESAEDAYHKLQKKLNAMSPAEAIVELKKLIESYPDFAVGHNDLAVFYYNTGNKDEALHHYQQAAHLQPENLTLQKNLADFLFVEQGRVEEALQIYVDILETYPADVETLLITGHICAALKKFDNAKDFYKRVLALEPDNEDASQNLNAINNRQTELSSSQTGAIDDMSVSSTKVEAMDLNSEESENTDTEDKTSVSIIVSLDGIQNRVKECLKSIQVHTAAPYEILLIDREAAKGMLKWAQQIVESNDHYHLIACTRQAGWAECINQAVEKANGDLIVLMHNDVVLPEGWLNAFLMGINFEPNTGVVGPMSNRTTGIQQVIQTDESDRTDFEAAAAEFYEQNQYRRVAMPKLSDVCLVFRRELVEKIGSFDKQFVSAEIGVEDFCNRAAAAGYQNWAAADTYVYHYDRHKIKKNAATKNSAGAEDRKKVKEKWSGMPNTEAGAFQTVQLLAKADELSQKGQVDRAVEILLVAIGTQPQEKCLYFTLAEVLIAAKRFQDAKEALNEMPPTNGDPEPQMLELLGYAEEGLANYEASQTCVEQVLVINPQHAPALNLKGILDYHNGDRDSAEKHFKQAINADPGYGEPYTNLGMLQLEAERQADALRFFEKGFRLTPTDADIAANYHSLVAETAGYEKAENVASEAATLYPNNQKIKYMLIDFLVQQGKYEMAMPEIEDTIIEFGIEDGILAAALKFRGKIGPMTVDKSAKKAPVSVCMIIKDEEKYLARCLASVKPIVDEMIVVDTGSTDRSKDIAVTFGARVYDYEWDNDFAAARNFSISKASGEWILILDGDEGISPLDYDPFNKIVIKKPKAPVAYSITTRNYNKLANIVGWVPNDGKYPAEEAGIGWLPSEKVRLFYGKDQIWFEGAVHELVDPVLKRNSIEIRKCSIPVHHYGRLDQAKLNRKGEIYFEIGEKKLLEMGEDVNTLRELAIQATILERNQEALDLWQRLLALNPIPELAAIAYVNMGTVYSRLEEFEAALDVARKALRSKSNLKEAQYNCAVAELHCGNAPAALTALEDLLSGFPDYPPARFILSVAYCCVDQKDRGLGGIRNQKNTPVGIHLAIPFLELGQSLIAAKQIPYALAALGAAIECDIISKDILDLFAECIKMKDEVRKLSEITPTASAEPRSTTFENLPH